VPDKTFTHAAVPAAGWCKPPTWALGMGPRHDYRPALTAVTAPVLVWHRTSDLHPEAASRLYSDAFPNARYQVIQGSGATQFMFEEQPATLTVAVEGFLDTP
jgi:hypothetical protein